MTISETPSILFADATTTLIMRWRNVPYFYVFWESVTGAEITIRFEEKELIEFRPKDKIQDFKEIAKRHFRARHGQYATANIVFSRIYPNPKLLQSSTA